MKHDDYQQMLAAKSVAALDAEDDRTLDLHLENCSECSAELRELQNTAAQLALEATPMEPSPEIRDRILAKVHAEKNRPSEIASAPRVVPFSGRKNIWTPLGSFGAIAASVLLIALTIGLFMMWREYSRTRDDLTRLTGELRVTNEKLATERALITLLATPGSKMAELTGTNMAPGAHAMLAYDKTGHAMLMTKNLPMPPAGKAYQLWFIKDNQKMPGKTFMPDERGNAMLEDQVPSSAMANSVYAITLEPATGVQVPTGAIYLVSGSS